MRTIPELEEGAHRAKASGTLPNGKPVIVNSDGTVSVVGAQSQSTAAGTPVDPDAGTGGQNTGCVFDSNSNKVVVVFRDTTNSGYGTARVGTVDPSNNSISFGSKAVFNSGNSTQFATAFDSNSNKVVISYEDGGNSSQGTAVVGTVSGTDISFGSEDVFEAGTPNAQRMTFDSSNNKVVIAYSDGGNSNKGKAVVGTVSDTSISFGTPVQFESGQCNNIAITFDSNSNKVVIAFADLDNSFYGKSVVGTVSGTAISFGNLVTFNSARSTYMSAAFDTTANKVVITYSDGGNSYHGSAIVGTVSGTNISYGSEAVFYAGSANYTATNFDSGTGNIVISYQDAANSYRGTVVTGTVSGTGIGSFGTAVVFEATVLEHMFTTFDSTSNRVINTYADNGDGDKAKVVVIRGQGSVPNLTSENFIGISKGGAYAAGSSATVDIIGSVSENQSSLTAGQSYFVQTDGTLGLTADDPSVFAGTAVSATNLLVKV